MKGQHQESEVKCNALIHDNDVLIKKIVDNKQKYFAEHFQIREDFKIMQEHMKETAEKCKFFEVLLHEYESLNTKVVINEQKEEEYEITI